MRTKEELVQFLHNVVGEDYIFVNDDTIDIKPFQIGTSSSNGNTISGDILFKGESIETFNNSERNVVQTIVDAMNYSYSQSIRDCISVDPDMINEYKMSRFKFS